MKGTAVRIRASALADLQGKSWLRTANLTARNWNTPMKGSSRLDADDFEHASFLQHVEVGVLRAEC
jgi:hypothetical protein